LLSLLFPLLAAGCGGGSTKTATQVETRHEGPAPSRADYVELADAICKNHQSRREDLESQAGDLGHLDSKGKAHRVAGLLREESDNRMAEVRELETLQAPPADAGTLDSILSAVRAEAVVIERWAQAYDDLDAERIRSLQIRLGLTAAKAANQARSYGFEVCGQQ